MLTHVDNNQNPTMVDITHKDESIRMALAQAMVKLPESMRSYLQNNELVLKKGPVFQTAIIAGTMAVKKTHELIPFCHQIPVESCKFEINIDSDLLVTIHCRVKTSFKTGVEMEALHGATVAALTIYDMCKAVSHDIEIVNTRLLAKTGGKRTILVRPTYGLVLTGGKSARMGEPKALLNYRGMPHAKYIYNVLDKYCDQVFLSSQKNQWSGTQLENLPSLEDRYPGEGPMAGILSAFEHHPDVNWIVIACDLPFFNEETVQTLLANTHEKSLGTAFKNLEKGFPEALCALYTPMAYQVLKEAFNKDIRCPVKVLKAHSIELLEQKGSINLSNINTKEELHALS